MQKLIIARFSGGGGQTKLLSVKGFTLAEVLITLGIIGIVAAMTLPALTGAYRKRVVETELQRSFSELNQLFRRSEVDNGDAIYWDWPYLEQDNEKKLTADEFFQKYYAPYLKVISKKNYYTDGYKLFAPDGSELTINNSMYESQNYNLADGRVMRISTWFSLDPSVDKDGVMGSISIGTSNRSKEGFIAGKNYFTFFYRLKGKNLTLMSNSYRLWSCQTLDENRAGFIHRCQTYEGNDGINPDIYCTFMIYCNNWKIPKDYPVKF